MPVYEYRCTQCLKEFEYQQRMADPPRVECEACGGALERLISRTAFQLKGGGWYKDLYASAKPANEATRSDGPSGDTASDAATKSDAKPDSPAGGGSGSEGTGSSGAPAASGTGSSGSSSGSATSTGTTTKPTSGAA